MNILTPNLNVTANDSLVTVVSLCKPKLHPLVPSSMFLFIIFLPFKKETFIDKMKYGETLTNNR